MGAASDDGRGDGPRAAVEHLLHTARQRLGMEAAFLAELTEHEQIHRATTGADADSFTIFDGGRLPRLEGYCRRVMETDAPWVIRDTAAEPAVRHLRVTAAGHFGAYIGVPVKLPDGTPFGTLCCLSHSPRPDLDDGHVATLQALAEVLGFHVGQLSEHRALIGDLEERAAELTGDLRATELRLEVFKHVIDASPNAKLLLEADSLRIAYANAAAAALACADRDGMVGTHPWDHHLCWSQHTLLTHLAPLRASEADQVRYLVEPSDVTPALDVQAQRVALGGDEPAFILWTGHDVTSYHEVEQRLQRALELERRATDELRRVDGLRNAFLTAVSHELRTPLTTVLGVAETLRGGRVSGDAAAAMLDRLARNADRLERLLTDLLDLNQFEHGALELQRRTVRLDHLIRDALAELDVTDRDLRLDLEEVEAAVAPVKIERLIVNLVHNAATHTPPGTPVRVQLTEDPEGVSIVVSDRGPGVPEAERRTIFAPFEQGATAPAHRPGTGIGLSLVAAFAELHGGAVWIDEAEGGGAAFHVRLPTADPA